MCVSVLFVCVRACVRACTKVRVCYYYYYCFISTFVELFQIITWLTNCTGEQHSVYGNKCQDWYEYRPGVYGRSPVSFHDFIYLFYLKLQDT